MEANTMAGKDHIVRIACDVAGHDEDWIEYDTSAWTLAEYRSMFYAAYPDALRFWVEKDSVAWHLIGDGGAVVAHPGRGGGREAFLRAYRQLGDEGLRVGEWLAQSPWLAMQERLTASKKSSAGGAEGGT